MFILGNLDYLSVDKASGCVLSLLCVGAHAMMGVCVTTGRLWLSPVVSLILWCPRAWDSSRQWPVQWRHPPTIVQSTRHGHYCPPHNTDSDNTVPVHGCPLISSDLTDDDDDDNADTRPDIETCLHCNLYLQQILCVCFFPKEEEKT